MIKKIQEVHPDLYDKNAPSPANEAHLRLYTAVLYLMKQFFVFDAENHFLQVRPVADPGEPADVTLRVWPRSLGDQQGDRRTDKIKVLAVYGALMAKNFDDPSMGRDPASPPGMNEQVIWEPQDDHAPSRRRRLRMVPRFVEALTRAVQQYNANRELYEKVFSYLREVGESPPGASPPIDAGEVGDAVVVRTSVFATQLAAVVERLVEQRISADAPQIRLHISHAVAQSVASATSGGRPSGIDIDLPDLDSELAVEIEADNVRAQSVLYFAAQLEDMRFFTAADQVAHLFQVGQLPLTRGAGADNIFQYIKSAQARFTEVERRSMYARSFGFAQGGIDDATPNREFSDLWIRALSLVSSFSRQSSGRGDGDEETIILNMGDQYDRVHHMQVYKTLRDLAVNQSVHGYGMTHYGAIELQETIRTIRNMLSHPDVLSAFGVRDYFQLIERVAQMYMSSDVNSLRQRVMAQAGSHILQWLADRSDVLASPRPPRPEIFLEPLLVNNVEKWLAVTGTSGETLQRFAQPVPVASQPTLPSLTSLRSVTAAVSSTIDDLNRAISGGVGKQKSANTLPEA